MDSPQARARRRQRLDQLASAAARAVGAAPTLQLRGGRALRVGAGVPSPLPIRAAHLQLDKAELDPAAFRAAADGAALRLLYSDADLHRRLMPVQPVARVVFEMLEQLRVETLVPHTLPGVAVNLARRYDAWADRFHGSGLTETADGALLYGLFETCRARLTGLPARPATEAVVEPVRAVLAERLGDTVACLRRHRRDQARYGEAAAEVARVVADMCERDGEQTRGRGPQRRTDRGFFLLLDDADTDFETAPAATGSGASATGAGGPYRVWTSEFDQEVPVTRLVRPGLLPELRERLDELVADRRLPLRRLARSLHALLAHPASDAWEDAQESGWLDGRRLAQLVASPAERRVFRAEHTQPTTDCLVTLLLDCSGSMRGHAESVLVLVDVLARALELAGAAVEVLGFTTRAWNGGRTWRSWRSAGCPAAPGRLNEIQHIVVKDADTPWRRSRHSVAALLKPDLYREGLDGEAVTWACRRAAARPEGRRVVLVVSDGSPMDSATTLANGEDFLDAHLRQVVEAWTAAGVEIRGIGVGLDLRRFYPESVVIDPAEGVTPRLLGEVLALLRGPAAR